MPNRATSQAYLTFMLGDEKFAIHVDYVQEIVEPDLITRVPDTPEYMLGIINLRGKVLPLLDTRIKLGLPSMPPNVKSRILILHIKDADDRAMQIGAIVDMAREVVLIDPHQVQPPVDVQDNSRAITVTGIVNDQGNITMILDVNKVFTMHYADALPGIK